MIIQGGISLAEIGTMAWNGIKEAIPGILIGILVEKLVSMLVPAAGMILTVIEGLQAAWGTASQILQVFERFIAFLKAIKSGTAGPSFGSLLASAAVTVIDFVSNWLIKKLVSAAKKVAGKIKGIAQGLKDKFSKKGKNNKDKDKKGSKDKKGNKDKKGKDDKKDKDKEKDQEIKERVEKVERELKPKVQTLIAKKPSKLRLKAQLAIWRLAYRLQKLDVVGEKGKFDIIAKVNPTIDLADGWTFDTNQVLSVLEKIASEYVTDAEALKEGTSTTQRESTDPISLESRESGTSSVTLRDRQAYRDRRIKAEESIPVASEGKTSTIPGESTFLDLREPGNALTSLRDRQAYQIGTTQSGSPLGYKHQPTPINEQWQEIAGLESDRGNMYPTLKKRLADVKVGEMFTKILRGEALPDLPTDQREAIGELFGLWYAKEPSHPKGTQGHRRDLVYSLMITQMMTPETGKEHLDINKGIDLHPASFGGAQQGARRVTSEMEKSKDPPRQGTKIRQKRDERYKREKDTIKAWFKRNMTDLPVLTREPTIADVENFVGTRFLWVRGPEIRQLLFEIVRRLPAYEPEELIEMASTATEHDEVVDVLFRIAVGFPNFDPQVFRVFETYLKHPTPLLREATVQAIAYRLWPESVKLIEKVVQEDTDEDVQQFAQSILNQIKH
ncbi:hypothetical protein FJR04_25430 [Anabaena sp. UHCC 0204]|nr:hypothetical protein [Anabaena sp. UHCC 0204]